MLYKSKLRGSFGRIYPISLIIVYVLCVVEAFIRMLLTRDGMDIRIVPVFSMAAMGVFFLLAGIFQLLRYKLWIYPVIGFFAGLGCVLAIFLFGTEDDLYRIIYVVNLLVIILIVVASWNVLAPQERFEANARRLFKLAAEQIEDSADGFTGRPFSAGKVLAETNDLPGFSRFINGKFIARAFYRDDITYFAFSMNRSVLRIEGPAEVSYVAFNSKGEVTVQVSEADYRQYRKRINFDQLCASMADLFSRFLEYYRQGVEHRIITELKTAR